MSASSRCAATRDFSPEYQFTKAAGMVRVGMG